VAPPRLARLLPLQRPLTIRIDVLEDAGDLSVRVAGGLDERSAHELQQLCRGCATAPVIDLSGLQSADDAALGVLEALRASGSRVVGASPYVQLLLAGRCRGSAASAFHFEEKEDE
jgi:hypothetical protein